jgi:hypothetical protein
MRSSAKRLSPVDSKGRGLIQNVGMRVAQFLHSFFGFQVQLSNTALIDCGSEHRALGVRSLALKVDDLHPLVPVTLGLI